MVGESKHFWADTTQWANILAHFSSSSKVLLASVRLSIFMQLYFGGYSRALEYNGVGWC